MKSNYNKIGQYIRLVDERNFDLKVETLLGLTINKDFIPSVANTVGSDMSRYKIIRKNQFACSLMQVRRDKKIPVALQRNYKEAIISQAYPVFDVTNKDELLPEYLMMWFTRSEFDREACFYAVGGVRGSLEWEDFCNMQLPVPDIEKQKSIVKEHNTIVNRIKLNEQLNQKLEETAQAIYKQWFVDFEFPDDNGEPYKSSGGDMVFNEELGEEIPVGWRDGTFESISKEIVCGKTPSTADTSNFGNYMPFITIPDMHDKIFIQNTNRYISEKGANSQKLKTLPPNSICVSCIATPGLVILTAVQSQTNQQINSIICKKEISHYYAYFAVKKIGYKIIEWSKQRGSIGANMNKSEFSLLHILVPIEAVQDSFHEFINSIFANYQNIQQEIYLIQNMKEILLLKMAKA